MYIVIEAKKHEHLSIANIQNYANEAEYATRENAAHTRLKLINQSNRSNIGKDLSITIDT